MSAKKRQKLREKDVGGLKLFKKLSGVLDRLHEVGCDRDVAGNRVLHMDQYMMLLILYMFTPMCTSLRALQQMSELRNVQRKLGVPRSSLGSLSEARQVFDASLLDEIVRELAIDVPTVIRDAKLENFASALIAVDGSLLKALPKMAWALWVDDTHRAAKVHIEFDILKHVPVSATITSGHGNEKDVLAQNLRSDCIYVVDRGYAKYGLFQQILDARSSFVCRVYDNALFEVIDERVLDRDAKDANIVRDVVVNLGSESNRDRVTQPVRLIQMRCTPHEKRNSTSGPSQNDTMLICTDRLDLSADVIASMYRHRWSIEIFFRFFKHVLGCRHLLSQHPDGIELQTYAAIIACLLIALWTQRPPTLRTFEMLCYRFCGLADDDDLLAHIRRLPAPKNSAK